MQVVKQRGEFDCLLACLAMARRLPYDELWTEAYRQTVEENRGVYGSKVDEAFLRACYVRNEDYWLPGIPSEWSVNPALRRLLAGRRALLQVPSLNYQSAKHIVYWDGKELHDPSNKQVYRWIENCTIENVWIFNEMV